MGLFSDVDWTIILVVGGFLLLGGNNTEMLRTVGRLYGKAMSLRNELFGQLREAMQMPPTTARDPHTTLPANPALTSEAPIAGVTLTTPPVSPGVWAIGQAHAIEPLAPEDRFKGAP